MKVFRFFLLAAMSLTISAQAAEFPAVARVEFDENDATAAVQAAIDSKAKRVVLINPGKPWNVRPLKLASDQEIVLEKGAVLQAKRGEFKERHQMLLRGNGVKNVIIRGEEGATVRMWKSDYQAPPYEKSEWRHAIGLYACENVTISGLTIEESGGDGVYLGAGGAGEPCRKVTISGVSCVESHRQGISVISAEDLLIENCAFDLTSGTAPQAGIDFEPNSPRERLKHCVLRNCTFSRNHAYGILFALAQLDYDSEPVDIRMENCLTSENGGSVYVSVRNPAGPRGRIALSGCTFENDAEGVLIRNKAARALALEFSNCRFVKIAEAKAAASPIVVKADGDQGEPLGGLRFDDCTIMQAQERRPLAYDDLGNTRLKDVSGAFNLVTALGKTRVELTQALLDEWFPWSAEIKEYTAFDMNGLPFEPAFPHARRPFPAAEAWQRGTAQYLLWGRAGGDLNFTLTLKALGKAEIKNVVVRMIAPSGKSSDLPSPDGAKPMPYKHKATEDGLHRLVVEAGQYLARLEAPGDVSCLLAPRGAFHFAGRAGPLYFNVPAGVKEFGINVGGGGGTELAKATIVNAERKVVATKDNIGRGERFAFTRPDGSAGDVWSLILEKPSEGVLEDVHVLVSGIPSLLSASPEAVLRPASDQTEPRFARDPVVLVIGDSLAASYPNPPADRPSLTGWAQVLSDFLREGVVVRNEAKSGASTKSFLMRGFWQKAIEGPQADYLLIQFGGNDSKHDERFADAGSTFRDLLRGYISQARGLGIKPVLVSSPVARTFDEKGKITTTIDAYVTAMREVASAEKIPFIDLQARSKSFCEKLGPEACLKLNASAEDRAHFSREGAMEMARLVAQAMREVEGLRGLVKER
jgi:lysophospholipase L1-like esterase